MKHKTVFTLIFCIMISSFLLSSCFQQSATVDADAIVGTALAQTQIAIQENLDNEAFISTAVAQTQLALGNTSSQGQGADDEPTISPIENIPPTLTLTPSPTITSTPTETLTPTLSEPQVHVDVNTNCRVGPGQIYDIVGSLLISQIAKVVGRYQAGGYWVIENPNASGECWIWDYYATVEGPINQLPYYTQPPTPTPIIDWSGTWMTKYGLPPGPYDDITVTLIQTDTMVTGSFTYSGDSYIINGTLSADKMTLTGTWDNGGASGPLTWYWLNPNQFNGNENTTRAWCGSRNSAGAPTPCIYP